MVASLSSASTSAKRSLPSATMPSTKRCKVELVPIDAPFLHVENSKIIPKDENSKIIPKAENSTLNADTKPVKFEPSALSSTTFQRSNVIRKTQTRTVLNTYVPSSQHGIGQTQAVDFNAARRSCWSKNKLEKGIKLPEDIDDSFDDFPYYLGENTKENLINSTSIRLSHSEIAKHFTNNRVVTQRIMLRGPTNSDLYQMSLIKALAKYFDAKLLIVSIIVINEAGLRWDESDEAKFSKEFVDKNIFKELIEVVSRASETRPMIVFMRAEATSIMERAYERNLLKEEELKFPDNTVFVGSCVQVDNLVRNPEPTPKALALLANLLGLGKKEAKLSEPSSLHRFAEIFTDEVCVEIPRDKSSLAVWKEKLEYDAKKMKEDANSNEISIVLDQNGMDCHGLQNIRISDRILTKEDAERIVRRGLSHHLMNNPINPIQQGAKLLIPYKSLQYGITMLEKGSNNMLRKSIKNVEVDSYEKNLLDDVISADDIGVNFDDIGALESVKSALKELVMLPLQRPELFRKGLLQRPCKGILLFGPPGTGKTMLAKAVATEVGANFINASLSSLGSKWFCEAEKNVKAVFTLASKIAPCVIFVDEVDGMLGTRGSSGEHEAMRKMKNEFMTNWDGLCTKDKERVVVLAATNRPFDLDEAVIRRFPRRLMVNLPDSINREKILRVILEKEEMASDVDLQAIANMTEGYSGSDLKNLCVVAAHCPLRELLEQEEKERSLALAENKALPALQGGEDIRALNMADFKFAHRQVCASVPSEFSGINKLVKWNNEFGEGASRKKEQLSYYM